MIEGTLCLGWLTTRCACGRTSCRCPPGVNVYAGRPGEWKSILLWCPAALNTPGFPLTARLMLEPTSSYTGVGFQVSPAGTSASLARSPAPGTQNRGTHRQRPAHPPILDPVEVGQQSFACPVPPGFLPGRAGSRRGRRSARPAYQQSRDHRRWQSHAASKGRSSAPAATGQSPASTGPSCPISGGLHLGQGLVDAVDITSSMWMLMVSSRADWFLQPRRWYPSRLRRGHEAGVGASFVPTACWSVSRNSSGGTR